jgi:hypothetical protein
MVQNKLELLPMQDGSVRWAGRGACLVPLSPRTARAQPNAVHLQSDSPSCSIFSEFRSISRHWSVMKDARLGAYVAAKFALVVFCFALPSVAVALKLTPQQFNAGALLLTQKAFNDGVNRYNQWFWDMISYLEEQPTFPAESQWGGCGNPQYQYFPDPTPCPSFAGQKCSRITLDQSKVRFQIAAGNKMVVSAPGVKVVTGARVWLRESKHILFWCVHSDICNNNVVSITTTFDLTLVFDVAFDLSSGVITISSEPPALGGLQDDLEGCRPDWWARHTGNWHQQLNNAIKTFIEQAAAKETSTLALPHEFYPDPSVKVTYVVTAMLWCPQPLAAPCMTHFPDAYVVFIAIGTIQFVPPNGAPPVTYIPDPVYAAVTVPLDFPPSGPDAALPMLTAVRMSAIVLSGLMWVADQSGATAYHSNGTILDASFNMTVSYSPPTTGIRSLNILNMTIASGLVDCRCWLTANATTYPDAKPVMVISFENVLAIGTVLFTNDTFPGLIIRIDHIDTSQMTSAPILPPLPLPLDFQTDMVKLGVAGLQPVMNLYLQHNPFLLPSELLPFTSHPILTSVPLEAALPHGAGFIQILSVCSFEGQSQFDKCMYHSQTPDVMSPSVSVSVREDQGGLFMSSKIFTGSNNELRNSDDSEGLLLNLFMGTSTCEYSMQSSSTVYSLTPTVGACLPMQPVDPTVNFTSYYNLTGYSQSLNLSALCDDQTCKNCLVLSEGGLSESCIGIASETSSFTLGEVCKGSASIAGGFVIATFNPNFYGAATCDVVVADGNADRLVSFETLGPADDICRSGPNGLFSSVAAKATGNLDFRFNCGFSNCSSCEIELSDITPDQCTILYSNFSQIVAVKVWSLADIGVCDASKESITTLIIIILVSVFGFIAGIAIVRILYMKQYVLKSSCSSFTSHVLESVVNFREIIRNRKFISRLKSCVTTMMMTALESFWQHAVDMNVWFKTSFGWRLSKSREQPIFGDLVQFVLVCLCGAVCKWWSEVWLVRHY